MDTSNLKNIVVLKDLPSNLVEEAIVVLKQNKKNEKLEFVDSEKNKNQTGNLEKKTNVKSENSKDYIVKEAQLLIAEYILKTEKKNQKESQSIQNLKKKYKKARALNYFLSVGIAFVAIMSFFI